MYQNYLYFLLVFLKYLKTVMYLRKDILPFIEIKEKEPSPQQTSNELLLSKNFKDFLNAKDLNVSNKAISGLN